MKKVFALILALLLACCALAEGDGDAALLDAAQGMAERLTALCGTEGYAELYITSEGIVGLVRDWGGDWTSADNRRRAAVLSLDRESLVAALPAVLEAAGLPETLADYADFAMQRIATVPASYLNARAGANWLAATAVATLSDLRLLEGQDPGITLVLLDYGEAHPLVLTSFCVAPDGAALISAAFAASGGLADTLFAIAGGAYDLKGLASAAAAEDDTGAAQALLGALDAVRVSLY